MKHHGFVGRIVAIGLAAAACTAPTPSDFTAGDAASDRVIFVTQTVPADVGMQALYEGKLIVDAAGCVRLQSEDEHTVVWPHGYTVAAHGDVIVVRDSDGREVGVMGGRFELSGGEVPELHEGIPLAQADRARLRDTCPGRFWIVSE